MLLYSIYCYYVSHHCILLHYIYLCIIKHAWIHCILYIHVRYDLKVRLAYCYSTYIVLSKCRLIYAISLSVSLGHMSEHMSPQYAKLPSRNPTHNFSVKILYLLDIRRPRLSTGISRLARLETTFHGG